MDAGFFAVRDAALVAKGSVESYEYRIFERAGYRFNYSKVIGPIGLETRIQLYGETLPHVVNGTYFGILDNAEGFENDLSLDAIKHLDTILIGQGVHRYFGATVTKDIGYSKIVKLARTNMETVGMDGAVIEVADQATALDFIYSKIDEACGRNA